VFLHLQVHTYNVHGRFSDLRAPSVLARLQLAALYAATSTRLPEPNSCLTGAQMAMQLLRQSWRNTPLSAKEHMQLHSIPKLGGQHEAGLELLVRELQLSSVQLLHLHEEGEAGSIVAPQHRAVPPLDPDAGTCYLQEVEPPGGGWLGFSASPRRVLTGMLQCLSFNLSCLTTHTPSKARLI